MYLYKETTLNQAQAIETALKTDWTLNEKLQVLKTSISRLDKITQSPRTRVVLNVLGYARRAEAEKELY